VAITIVPLTFARGIVAASGTSVIAVDGAAAAAPVPDNCYTVLVTNPSTTVVGLVGIGTAPTALTAGINAQRVPPGATLTLGIGTAQRRGFMNQATVAGSGLIYDSIGGAVTLEITYLSQIGSP
jgi:hypothetical protein